MGRSYPANRKKQKPFSHKEIEFVIKHNDLTRAEIALKMQLELGVDRDVYAIKNLCRKHGIKSSHKASPWNKGTSKFSDQQIAYIREARKTKGLIEITDSFNKKYKTSYQVSSIKSICQRFNIEKEFEHFPIGYQPWNKGLKNNGQWGFQKNGFPPNMLEIGTEIFCNKRQFYLVKTSLDKKAYDNFTPKHILIWKAHYGDIPEGKIVSFKDGIKTNTSIDNLELIDRHELGYRVYNKFYTAPLYLRETIRQLSALQATIQKKKRPQRTEKQQKVIEYLEKLGKPATLETIKLAVWNQNTNADVAFKALNRLVKKGKVVRVKRGLYALEKS